MTWRQSLGVVICVHILFLSCRTALADFTITNCPPPYENACGCIQRDNGVVDCSNKSSGGGGGASGGGFSYGNHPEDLSFGKSLVIWPLFAPVALITIPFCALILNGECIGKAGNFIVEAFPLVRLAHAIGSMPKSPNKPESDTDTSAGRQLNSFAASSHAAVAAPPEQASEVAGYGADTSGVSAPAISYPSVPSIEDPLDETRDPYVTDSQKAKYPQITQLENDRSQARIEYQENAKRLATVAQEPAESRDLLQVQQLETKRNELKERIHDDNQQIVTFKLD